MQPNTPLTKMYAGSDLMLNGGGEGNRTPVRKHAGLAFSERIHGFKSPLAARPMAGLRLR